MKIYVATHFPSAPLAKAIMEILIGDGHEITYDWTSHDVKTSRRDQAYLDIQGVLMADCVVVQALPGCKGTWFEAGCHYGTMLANHASGGAEPRVIVIADRQHTIFEELDGVYSVSKLKDARALLKFWESGQK